MEDGKPPIVVALDQRPSPRRGVFFWAMVAVVAALALVLVGKVMSRVSTAVRDRRLYRQCATMAPHGHVLLVLYAPVGAPRRAANTVLSAFRRAHCGPSLRVAVYQEVPVGSSGVYEAILEQATDAERAWAKDRVAVVTSMQDKVGLFWAWGQLLAERNVFPSASWVMSVQPGAVFANDWEKVLVQAHRRAQSELNRKHVALTFVPGKARRPKRPRRRMKTTFDLSFLTEQAAEAVVRSDPPAWKFPVVMDFKGYVPTFSERRFPETPARVVQPLGVTHRALFAPAKAIREMTELSLFQEPVASYAVDVALSAMLWMDRYAFAIAPPVVSDEAEHRTDRSLRPAGWDGKAFSRLLMDDYDPYFSNYLGVDLEDRVVTGKAMLGVLPGEENEDVLAKYGSLSEFDRAVKHYGIE